MIPKYDIIITSLTEFKISVSASNPPYYTPILISQSFHFNELELCWKLLFSCEVKKKLDILDPTTKQNKGSYTHLWLGLIFALIFRRGEGI